MTRWNPWATIRALRTQRDAAVRQEHILDRMVHDLRDERDALRAEVARWREGERVGGSSVDGGKE